jgi:hypothetical protein
MAKGGHSGKENRKVFKQMKKCKEIKNIIETANGYKVVLIDNKIDPFANHWSSNGFHHLRRWLKKYTSLKNLKWS